MHFAALPESDHPQVALRPIAAADLPVWHAILSRPAVYEFTSWNHPTPDDLEPYVWSEAMREPSHLLRLAIALRATGELIGTIGFHTVTPPHLSAELAYDLAPEHWGRGIATQLCRRVAAWAHADAGLTRVQATVLTTNARSIAVLERAGFEREGLLRSYRRVRGRPGNFYMYSHLGPDGPA